MKRIWALLLAVILSLQLCGLCSPVFGAGTDAASNESKTASAENEAKSGSAENAKTASPAETAPAKTGSPVGVWKLTEMNSDGQITSKEDLEKLELVNMVFYMELLDGGKAFISGFGEDMEGTWDESSITFNDTPVPYTFDKDKGTISFEQNSSKMTFERSTIEAIHAILGYVEGVLDETVQYSKEEQVLLDSEEASVRITGYKADPTGFTALIHCENKTDHDLMISTGNSYLNKYKIEPIWAVTLDAKESEDSAMVFKTPDIAKCGISAIDEMILSVNVIDAEKWESLGDSENITVYPTGKKAEEIKVPDRTPAKDEKVLVDNDDFAFIIQGAGENLLLGYCADCYFENKTDKPLTFMWTKSQLNGTDISSYYAEESLPGTRGYSQAAFMKSSLEEKQIGEVKEIKFTLQVYDTDTYNKIFEEELTCTP